MHTAAMAVNAQRDSSTSSISFVVIERMTRFDGAPVEHWVLVIRVGYNKPSPFLERINAAPPLA